MVANKLSMGKVLLGALAIGSAPGGKRAVGITAVATPGATSPTIIYNFLAPTFALSAALISSSTNLNNANLVANSTGDVNLPFIGITVGDFIDVNPQFIPSNGVTWTAYTAAATAATARANTTAYIVGQVVKVTISSVVYAFACTTAGTSGLAAAAPTNTAPGSLSAADGTVVWTCLGTAIGQLRIHNATTSSILVSGNLNGNWTAAWFGLAA